MHQEQTTNYIWRNDSLLHDYKNKPGMISLCDFKSSHFGRVKQTNYLDLGVHDQSGQPKENLTKAIT